jgi:hypothetical protein
MRSACGARSGPVARADRYMQPILSIISPDKSPLCALGNFLVKFDCLQFTQPIRICKRLKLKDFGCVAFALNTNVYKNQ